MKRFEDSMLIGLDEELEEFYFGHKIVSVEEASEAFLNDCGDFVLLEEFLLKTTGWTPPTHDAGRMALYLLAHEQEIKRDIMAHCALVWLRRDDADETKKAMHRKSEKWAKLADGWRPVNDREGDCLTCNPPIHEYQACWASIGKVDEFQSTFASYVAMGWPKGPAACKASIQLSKRYGAFTEEDVKKALEQFGQKKSPLDGLPEEVQELLGAMGGRVIKIPR